MLQNLAVIDLAMVADAEQRIKLKDFNPYSHARQRNMLRFWVGQKDIIPTSAQLDAVLDQCIGATEDAAPVIELGEYAIRRYRDRLYLLSKTDVRSAQQVYRWNLKENLELPEAGLLLDADQLLSRYSDLSDEDIVEVRFRQGGEKFKADTHGLRKSLKNYFQEAGVPPWERDQLPLIFKNDELIAVWGYSNSDR